MPTPEEEVRDESADSLADSLCEARYLAFPASDHHDVQTCATCRTRVANAFAAVTRAATERAVRVVEGMRWSEHHPMCDRSGLAGCCGMLARNAGITDAITALREAQGGMDDAKA